MHEHVALGYYDQSQTRVHSLNLVELFHQVAVASSSKHYRACLKGENVAAVLGFSGAKQTLKHEGFVYNTHAAKLFRVFASDLKAPKNVSADASSRRHDKALTALISKAIEAERSKKTRPLPDVSEVVNASLLLVGASAKNDSKTEEKGAKKGKGKGSSKGSKKAKGVPKAQRKQRKQQRQRQGLSGLGVQAGSFACLFVHFSLC